MENVKLSLPVIASNYAIKHHSSTNHLYGNTLPYEVHLEMVVEVAKQFIHLIPEDQRETVIAACWCHDLIEDCQTYNDVKNETNEQVADLVYALTNEKGRNRKERASMNYYVGIINTPYAVFVKLCDRIANVKFSKESGSNMFEMYKKENYNFVTYIHHDNKYNEMFEYLISIFE